MVCKYKMTSVVDAGIGIDVHVDLGPMMTVISTMKDLSVFL